ncbi:MAG: DUF6599 family protein [Candidatus Glassbacteria bacterium]
MHHYLRLGAKSAVFAAFSFFLFISGCSSGGGGSAGGQGQETASGQAGSQAESSAGNLNSLLPAQGQTADWKMNGEPRNFGPENLWEYIDGGAEGYLVYKFQEVVTADYETADGSLQAVLDIYRMADRLCGFGIYSAERASWVDRIALGSEGYVTDNAVFFWQGPYYVKITAFEEGHGDKLKELAQSVAARLDAEPGNPEQLAAFPTERLIDGSQRYMAQDVLGHSELKNGFTADYELDGKEFKLFFILHDNQQDASHSYQTYHDFQQKYSRNLQDHTGEEYPLFSAEDSYYGKIVAMQAGRAVIGVLGLEDVELVNRYLQQMVNSLASLGMV